MYVCVWWIMFRHVCMVKFTLLCMCVCVSVKRIWVCRCVLVLLDCVCLMKLSTLERHDLNIQRQCSKTVGL